MKLYHYPKCSTCRKAIKFLNDKRIEFTALDITEQPPKKVELKAMLSSYDGDVKRLFNTSGMQYRELNMKEKLPKMSSQQAIDLLAGNGKLIKRPFLLNAEREGIVGFKEIEWQEFV